MCAVAARVTRIGVGVDEVVPANVVGKAIAIVVDPVDEFTRVRPQIVVEVGMVVRDPRVDDGDDHAWIPSEEVPSAGRVDVGSESTDLARDAFHALTRVAEPPELVEERVVRNGRSDVGVVRLCITHARLAREEAHRARDRLPVSNLHQFLAGAPHGAQHAHVRRTAGPFARRARQRVVELDDDLAGNSLVRNSAARQRDEAEQQCWNDGAESRHRTAFIRAVALRTPTLRLRIGGRQVGTRDRPTPAVMP